MSVPEGLTAAQHALGIPNIVQRILAWVHYHGNRELITRYQPLVDIQGEWSADGFEFDITTVPLPCTTTDCCRLLYVNSVWHAETIRYLWAVVKTSRNNSPPPHVLLERIGSERRQMYANCIVEMDMCGIDDSQYSRAMETLQTLSFPKLQLINLAVENDSQINLPVLGPNKLYELNISNTARQTSQENKDCYNTFFEQTTRLYPDLMMFNIHLWERCKDRDAVMAFKKKMNKMRFIQVH